MKSPSVAAALCFTAVAAQAQLEVRRVTLGRLRVDAFRAANRWLLAE